MKRTKTSKIAALAAMLQMSATVCAQNTQEPPSLEDLMKVEVTTVSKKPQKLANVAAAVYVITSEDIKSSGATSIAEVLALAPGMSVIRINSGRWGINARGYGDRIANKLLLLVDGRNAFNPAINGVFWETLQIPLEDIARIEVIRGPGASSWGTNAVNGVINVVTKSASSTQGVSAIAGFGNQEGEYARLRYGAATESNDVFFRGYLSAGNQKAFTRVEGGHANDNGRNLAGGLRFDGYLSSGGRWDLSIDSSNRYAESIDDYGIASESGTKPHDKGEVHTLRARYQHALSSNSEVQVQGAISQSRIFVGPVSDKRLTLDFDAQHRVKLFDRHDLVWGANLRLSRDDTSSTSLISFDEPRRQVSYVGAFVQDEIEVSDTLRLTLAARIDDSSLAPPEVQPTARLSWNFSPTQTIWAGATHAVRAPARGEVGLNLTFISGTIPLSTLGIPTAGIPVPQQFVPLVQNIKTKNDLGLEKLDAYELGWRSQWTPGLSTDFTAFFHRYTKLRDFSLTGAPMIVSGPTPGTIAAVVLPSTFLNIGSFDLAGLEFAADWRLSAAWRIQFTGWLNEVSKFKFSDPVVIPPAVHASLRTSFSPSGAWNFDFWGRYVSGRDGPRITQPSVVRNPQTTLDASVSFRPTKNFEFVLMGKNLTDSGCDPYSGVTNPTEGTRLIPTCARRGVIAQVRSDF